RRQSQSAPMEAGRRGRLSLDRRGTDDHGPVLPAAHMDVHRARGAPLRSNPESCPEQGDVEGGLVAKLFPRIDESLREFIGQQAMFFVATAPSSGGRVNLSPKGYRDTFAVLDDHTVAYLDLFGSGVETIAHLRDNGRITVMFCSFTRNSRILRLYGTGRMVRPDDAEFATLRAHFGSDHPGVRAAVVIEV